MLYPSFPPPGGRSIPGPLLLLGHPEGDGPVLDVDAAASNGLDLNHRKPVPELDDTAPRHLHVELAQKLAREGMDDRHLLLSEAHDAPVPEAIGGREVDDSPGKPTNCRRPVHPEARTTAATTREPKSRVVIPEKSAIVRRPLRFPYPFGLLASRRRGYALLERTSCAPSGVSRQSIVTPPRSPESPLPINRTLAPSCVTT